MRLQTFCDETFEFRVLVDPIATYNYVPLPEQPTIAIVPGAPETWRAVLPTLRRTGQPFRLAIKAEDKWGNPSDKVGATVTLKSSCPVNGLPHTVELKKGDFAAFVDGLAVDRPGDVDLEILEQAGTLLARANPLRTVEAAEPLPSWGDPPRQS